MGSTVTQGSEHASCLKFKGNFPCASCSKVKGRSDDDGTLGLSIPMSVEAVVQVVSNGPGGSVCEADFILYNC